MRIMDWSSDVCSSDLLAGCPGRREDRPFRPVPFAPPGRLLARDCRLAGKRRAILGARQHPAAAARSRVSAARIILQTKQLGGHEHEQNCIAASREREGQAFEIAVVACLSKKKKKISKTKH